MNSAMKNCSSTWKVHFGQGKNKGSKQWQVGSHQHQVASLYIFHDISYIFYVVCFRIPLTLVNTSHVPVERHVEVVTRAYKLLSMLMTFTAIHQHEHNCTTMISF